VVIGESEVCGRVEAVVLARICNVQKYRDPEHKSLKQGPTALASTSA